MSQEALAATEEHELKPKLVFVGKLFGMDLYIDLGRQREPKKKHDLAIKWLRQRT